MALPSTVVWEVRPTVGNDNNGGGFVPGSGGTDFSQQTSPQYALTGIASAGAGATVLYSGAASVMVGNISQVVSGTNFTTGFFQIISVNVGVSITFDRSVCTGIGASGVINIGGALATILQAYNNATTGGGNTIWVKASGSYIITTPLTLSGQNDFPLSFIGYTTTRGDNGQVTWTTATNSTSLVVMGLGNQFNWLFENFIFSNTAGTSATGFDGGLVGQNYLIRFKNCKFTGFTTALALDYVNSVHFNASCLFIENCEITGCSSHGIGLSGSNFIIGCYIHGNGGDGVHITATNSGTSATGACHFERCVIYNNTGNGIFVDQMNPSTQIMTWPQVINCAIVDNNGDGIQLNSGAGNNFNAFVLVNNIIESNQGFGINSVHSGAGYLQIEYNNAFGSGGTANASGNYNNLTADPTDITLTAEAFTTVGSNWTLNSTSGGGTACKAVGFPSSIP
jgi:hypothetical protein